jgi:glycosyltransferase involved in cell wall biosynthesis
MYPPHHLGGYELMWASWVRHALGAGNEVRVLASDFDAAEPDPTVEAPGSVARDLHWYWRDHAFPSLSLRERLRLERHNLAVLEREIDTFRPDAVCWWAMGGMSMSLIESVARRGLPALGVVVDDWLVYGPEVDGWRRAFAAPRPLAAVVERLTGVPTSLDLGKAAEWLFVSETTRRRAREGGADVGSGQIVHAGIDPSLFPPVAPREWEWRLLYLGRIDKRKGIATAIRVLDELPSATLHIVGGGDEEHRAELAQLADSLGVADRIRVASYPRERLSDAYAAADAVLFPVLWAEPFGLVPLEAMSVGRPVIATGTGGSGEYLRDGVNCLIFDPIDDPGALAGAVARLADDPSLRSRLREGGRKTAAELTEERFNTTVTAALAALGDPGRGFERG